MRQRLSQQDAQLQDYKQREAIFKEAENRLNQAQKEIDKLSRQLREKSQNYDDAKQQLALLETKYRNL